ncbi:MAG: TIR domain-containing protein [Chromatiaceae bacterium]|nr:TIR domain-containing protein [Gammaproteobacteria bacterium]MCP5306472.1 TIR domain-containing protein [Chromatiaceae bacterium]MCP5312024.1 TIR domain-containing protein [Chromatiaceae bacterium]
MATGTGYISISRERSVSYGLRAFTLVIDDQTVDKIRSGESKRFALPGGRHSIRVQLDGYKSRPLEVDLQAGETITVECGNLAPKTLRESFSLSGIGQSLKALSAPEDYLFVKRVGSDHAAAPAAPRRETPSPPRKARSDLTLFVSYRREDSRAVTGRICDRLTAHFGRRGVFRDVDSIPIGMDFRDKIRETIDQADMLVAVIGPRWVDIRDQHGEVRLAQPEDYVRLEIESALAKGIPVIPVLIDDAPMPGTDQLPESLAQFAYLNALFIPREPFFHAGVDKLIEEIEQLAGHAPQARKQFCVGCGSPLAAGQRFCTGCGRPTTAA